MDMVTAGLICVTIAFFVLLYRSRKSKGNPPPNVSVFSLLRDIIFNSSVKYDSYVEKLNLGDVYSVSVMKMFTLNSYQAIHEAFVVQGEVFSGRPKGKAYEIASHSSGIISTDGAVWQEHRRLMLRLMRDFGLGRPLVVDLVGEEIAAMREVLEHSQGNPVETQMLFSTVTNNIIARLLFGERCGTDDSGFKQFVRDLEESFTLKPIVLLLFIFPFILSVSWMTNAFDRFAGILAPLERMHDYIRSKIDEQEASMRNMDPQPTALEEATNVCEALLIERDTQERARPGQHTFTEWMLIRDLHDMFMAGTETTASTLNWAVAYLCVYPEVQARVQSEIETKIGRERRPTMADRQELPYVCAFMDEVMRCSSLVPLNVHHRTTSDTVLLGYDIPADSIVMCNLYGVHHDPRHWERPKEFYPEHFLSPEGEYRPSKFLIPFSLGRRACLGESLARMEYFLVFVSLMQSFEVRLADPDTDTKTLLEGKGLKEFIRHPLPHKVVFSACAQR